MVCSHQNKVEGRSRGTSTFCADLNMLYAVVFAVAFALYLKFTGSIYREYEDSSEEVRVNLQTLPMFFASTLLFLVVMYKLLMFSVIDSLIAVM